MTAETEKRGGREHSVIFTSVVCDNSRMKHRSQECCYYIEYVFICFKTLKSFLVFQHYFAFVLFSVLIVTFVLISREKATIIFV